MEKIFFIFILLINKITKILSQDVQVYSDDDIFITNTTDSYSDIPTDCYLFGTKYDRNYPFDKVILNVTNTKYESFWIHATTAFKRNINPIGIEENCDPHYPNDISLDACNKRCSGTKYLHQNDKTCICTDSNKIDQGLVKTEACEDGLCSTGGGCIVYQRVFSEEYMCGTYRYEKRFSGFWLYGTDKCSEKRNYSFICSQDKDPEMSISSNISWYEAYQKCKDSGLDLLENGKGIRDVYKDGRTYWVSYFRRREFFWGKVDNEEICVAANISENGTISLTSKFCTEKLPSLCYRDYPVTDYERDAMHKGSHTTIWIITGVFVVMVLLGILAYIVKRCKRIQTLKYLEGIIKENNYEKKEVKNEPSYSIIEKPACYSLAAAYSDPMNCVLTSVKETVDDEYDQVAYKTNIASDTQNELIVPENPYQMPDSHSNQLMVHENPYQIPDSHSNQLIVHENPYQIPDSHSNQLIVHENPYQIPDSHKE